MKQIKIFKGYVDYGNELDKLEKAVNDWIISNTIAVVDIKQSICSGRYDVIVITVVYDAEESLQKEKVKQTDSYDRYYFQDAANEYMSR
jgi:hypothetical protein